MICPIILFLLVIGIEGSASFKQLAGRRTLIVSIQH
jgi:hypothetical protein